MAAARLLGQNNALSASFQEHKEQEVSANLRDCRATVGQCGARANLADEREVGVWENWVTDAVKAEQ